MFVNTQNLWYYKRRKRRETMKKKNINVSDFSFEGELLSLAEAMQYAFRDEVAESEYAKQNKRYWIGQVLSRTKESVYAEIKNAKNEHAKELENSPLLLALMDMYIAVAETEDTNKLKDIYTAYQNLQKDCKFEDNKQAYFDAGCVLSTGFEDEKGIYVMYPIHLYGAYNQHGGGSDDHRGGYLYPLHKLNVEEVKELYETKPELFERSASLESTCLEIIKSQPTGPSGN